MPKSRKYKEVFLAWYLQYERVERMKAGLIRAKRQLKILRAIRKDLESKGEYLDLN